MRIQLSLIVLCSLALGGCIAARGTHDEQRTAIQQTRQDVLAELYRQKASAQAEIAASPGYGVFANANVNVVLASFGGGHGVIRDNRSGRDTYMKMGEIGVGLGAGVKDYRLVFVFHDADTMTDFIDKGWSFGGSADAAAKAGEQGAAVGGEAVLDGVTVYQLTESGLALQATIKGTKYWKDANLN